MQREQVLMTAAETAEYLNMGMTKTRELMKEQQNVFVVLIGKKKYVHKILLDKWLLGQVMDKPMCVSSNRTNAMKKKIS